MLTFAALLLPAVLPKWQMALIRPIDSISRQASSYDRAAVSPAQDWFANGDNGQYIRNEVNQGRNEHVMADLKGPGVVNRIWSANPSCTVRFYFDGETTPRMALPLADLLGKKTVGGLEGYEAARGWDLYAAIPYAQSLKITLDETGGWNHVYYHVGYRTLTKGQTVTSFDPNEMHDFKTGYTHRTAAYNHLYTGSITKAKPYEIHLSKENKAAGCVVMNAFSVQLPAGTSVGAMRGITLEIFADGERTVVAPMPDFFASSTGPVPFESLPMSVTKSGMMVCQFPMPFDHDLRIRFKTGSAQPLGMVVGCNTETVPEGSPYRFHAQYSFDSKQTRPMYDMHYLQAATEGRLVGVAEHIENPNPGWWGEGDEKIYIDGETFPSFFGTGTEDFFGYAWSNPQTYIRAYHGQPRCDGPGTFGHTTLYRWMIQDDICFENSVKFDLEMWHWIDCLCTCERVVYWYGKPGTNGNHDINPHKMADLKPPTPIKGAIEGEDLKIQSSTGGTHEVQDGFWEISGTKQLWWRDVAVGDKLTLVIPVAKPGVYHLTGNFCHAQDYGIHRLKVDGIDLGEHDFYSKDLKWSKTDLGVVNLKGTTATLEVTCTGNNPAAIPARMFGIDYLFLVPAN